MDKRFTSVYGVMTGLMAVFMLAGSVADVIRAPQAIAFMQHLGYPPYLLRFLGIAKIIGVTVVCLPMPQRLKEWAYAGLTIDVTGAVYSHLSVGDPVNAWMFPAIGLLLVGGSYLAWQHADSSGQVGVALPPASDIRIGLH